MDSPRSLKNLAIHTITTKPWSLEEALEAYSYYGIGGISIWQNAIEQLGARKAGKLIDSYSIEVVSYVRGGFFPSVNPVTRQKSIEHNKKMIEEAAQLNAPLLVLVCGADPSQPLSVSRAQILDGIESVLPFAEASGVKLGIEPLHPVYADTRSAVNTLHQANQIAENFNSDWLGVVVDVYHLWWDPQLETEIRRCGKNGNLFAFHICDWKVEPTDLLNDRGIMGEGCIPIKEIGQWVQESGFQGFSEVEIFSNNYWAMDQSEFLKKIIVSYQNLV